MVLENDISPPIHVNMLTISKHNTCYCTNGTIYIHHSLYRKRIRLSYLRRKCIIYLPHCCKTKMLRPLTGKYKCLKIYTKNFTDIQDMYRNITNNQRLDGRSLRSLSLSTRFLIT